MAPATLHVTTSHTTAGACRRVGKFGRNAFAPAGRASGDLSDVGLTADTPNWATAILPTTSLVP